MYMHALCLAHTYRASHKGEDLWLLIRWRHHVLFWQQLGQMQMAVTWLCLKSLGLQLSWHGETDWTDTYTGPISPSCAVCICAVRYHSVPCKNTSWVTCSPAEVKMAEVILIQCAWWVYAWVALSTQACVCLCLCERDRKTERTWWWH